jgi:hypothetical protein
MGAWRYSCIILNRCTRWKVNGHLHAPAALPPEKYALVLIVRRLGGPHSWAGCYGEGKNLLPLPEIDQTVQNILITSD